VCCSQQETAKDAFASTQTDEFTAFPYPYLATYQVKSLAMKTLVAIVIPITKVFHQSFIKGNSPHFFTTKVTIRYIYMVLVSHLLTITYIIKKTGKNCLNTE